MKRAAFTNQSFLHLLSFIQKKNNFSFSFHFSKQRNSIDLFDGMN